MQKEVFWNIFRAPQSKALGHTELASHSFHTQIVTKYDLRKGCEYILPYLFWVFTTMPPHFKSSLQHVSVNPSPHVPMACMHASASPPHVCVVTAVE